MTDEEVIEVCKACGVDCYMEKQPYELLGDLIEPRVTYYLAFRDLAPFEDFVQDIWMAPGELKDKIYAASISWQEKHNDTVYGRWVGERFQRLVGALKVASGDVDKCKEG